MKSPFFFLALALLITSLASCYINTAQPYDKKLQSLLIPKGQRATPSNTQVFVKQEQEEYQKGAGEQILKREVNVLYVMAPMVDFDWFFKPDFVAYATTLAINRTVVVAEEINVAHRIGIKTHRETTVSAYFNDDDDDDDEETEQQVVPKEGEKTNVEEAKETNEQQTNEQQAKKEANVTDVFENCQKDFKSEAWASAYIVPIPGVERVKVIGKKINHVCRKDDDRWPDVLYQASSGRDTVSSKVIISHNIPKNIESYSGNLGFILRSVQEPTEKEREEGSMTVVVGKNAALDIYETCNTFSLTHEAYPFLSTVLIEDFNGDSYGPTLNLFEHMIGCMKRDKDASVRRLGQREGNQFGEWKLRLGNGLKLVPVSTAEHGVRPEVREKVLEASATILSIAAADDKTKMTEGYKMTNLKTLIAGSKVKSGSVGAREKNRTMNAILSITSSVEASIEAFSRQKAESIGYIEKTMNDCDLGQLGNFILRDSDHYPSSKIRSHPQLLGMAELADEVGEIVAAIESRNIVASDKPDSFGCIPREGITPPTIMNCAMIGKHLYMLKDKIQLQKASFNSLFRHLQDKNVPAPEFHIVENLGNKLKQGFNALVNIFRTEKSETIETEKVQVNEAEIARANEINEQLKGIRSVFHVYIQTLFESLSVIVDQCIELHKLQDDHAAISQLYDDNDLVQGLQKLTESDNGSGGENGGYSLLSTKADKVRSFFELAVRDYIQAVSYMHLVEAPAHILSSDLKGKSPMSTYVNLVRWEESIRRKPENRLFEEIQSYVICESTESVEPGSAPCDIVDASLFQSLRDKGEMKLDHFLTQPGKFRSKMLHSERAVGIHLSFDAKAALMPGSRPKLSVTALKEERFYVDDSEAGEPIKKVRFNDVSVNVHAERCDNHVAFWNHRRYLEDRRGSDCKFTWIALCHEDHICPALHSAWLITIPQEVRKPFNEIKSFTLHFKTIGRLRQSDLRQVNERKVLEMATVPYPDDYYEAKIEGVRGTNKFLTVVITTVAVWVPTIAILLLTNFR